MIAFRLLGAALIILCFSTGAALPARAPAPPPAAAPPGPGLIPETRIVAVVNDEAITIGDLNSRIKMVMLSSGLRPAPDTEKRMEHQVLRLIVDEKLQMQEARRQ